MTDSRIGVSIEMFADDYLGWVEGDEANVFVATHDTERVSLLHR